MGVMVVLTQIMWIWRKRRTYRVERTKLGNGNDCEFDNGETETEPCNEE